MFIEDMHLYFEKKKPLKPGRFYVKIKIIENKAIENRLSKVFQKTAERENRFKSIISFRSLKDKLKLLIANVTKWIEKQRVLNMTL